MRPRFGNDSISENRRDAGSLSDSMFEGFYCICALFAESARISLEKTVRGQLKINNGV